jgi:hypothetical protein
MIFWLGEMVWDYDMIPMRLQRVCGKRLAGIPCGKDRMNEEKLALILWTACSSFLTSRATMVMSAPFCASPSANANPRPDDPPVI